MKTWIDDIDFVEETEGDKILDVPVGAKNPKPGTSFGRPVTVQGERSRSRIGRPPPSGFARPGTSSRAVTASRPITSTRPSTSTLIRKSTAASRSENIDQFSEMDVQRMAKQKVCNRVFCDYLLYHDYDPETAIDLCRAVKEEGTSCHLVAVESSNSVGSCDWWWEARSGKCLYRLGMLQEAESHFDASLEMQSMISTSLELANIFVKRDQPLGAISIYDKCLSSFGENVDCLLAKARIQEELNDDQKAIETFRRILKLDGSNVESMACLAAHFYYSDSPKIALRYYRRILQMGVASVEVWNNLGLCSLDMSRYDIALHCFNRALSLSTDQNASDVWYNIGIVALRIGEIETACQSFSIAIFLNPSNAEAMNNLGVIRQYQGRHQSAKIHFDKSRSIRSDLFEPCFNRSAYAKSDGNLQAAFDLVSQCIDIDPNHKEAQTIIKDLLSQFE